MLICGFAVQNCYTYAASSGILGNAARDKYEQQSEGDLGLLLGGRSESLTSIQAVAESPFIGHGSWARDSRYGAILQQTLSLHGYSAARFSDDLIPTHSHILGAWVEAGLLGAVFWMYAFYLAGKGVYVSLTRTDHSRVLTCYCALTLFWDIPFSPFGAQQRFFTALYMVVIVGSLARVLPLRRSKAVNCIPRQRLAPSFLPEGGGVASL